MAAKANDEGKSPKNGSERCVGKYSRRKGGKGELRVDLRPVERAALGRLGTGRK